jgi:hypothetical protein
MLQEGGLGRQIDQKVDAYRGNPEALQKQSKLSGDLMDALALQKVMSEKADAKRQLALSQEQNPATVAEQYEQQLMTMNKEELTAQTAGIMGERNKQKQKQLSAAAPPQNPQQQQQRPPMPQGGAPQGIAGAPRPPTQFAAQGGIIGYAGPDGSEVEEEGEEGSRLERALKALGLTYKEYKNLPIRQRNELEPKIQQEYVNQRKEYSKDLESKGLTIPNTPIGDFVRDQDPSSEGYEERRATESEERRKRLNPTPTEKSKANAMSGGISDAQSSALQGAMEIGGADLGAGVSGIAAEAKKKQDALAAQNQSSVGVLKPGGAPSIPNMGGAGVLKPSTGPAAGPAAGPQAAPAFDVDQQLQSILDTPAPNYSEMSKTQATDAMGDKFNTKLDERMDVDPEAKKQAETERLSGPSREMIMGADGKPVLGPDGKPTYKELGGFDREGKAKGLEKYLLQKEALDKKVLDPEAVDKRRTQAYMDGLITGGTGRTGTAARSQFDANIAKSEQDSIAEQKAMYLEDMKFDAEIADKIGTQAIKVFEIYADDVAKAMDTAATLGIANLEMFYKEAKMAYDSNQDGIKNKIDAIKTSTASDLNKLIQSQANFQDISNAANSLYEKMGKLETEFFAPFQTQILGIETELRKEGLDPARRKQLLDQLAEYDSRWEAHKSFIDGDKLMQIYKQLLEESASNKGFSSQLITQIENINKTSTGTSQQQTTGLANARQQAILKKQATTKYVPTD